MIFKEMLVNPFVFVSVGARCESTFSTGVRKGWQDGENIKPFQLLLKWSSDFKSEWVHTPPTMLYCYFRNQGCAIAKCGDLLHLTFAVQ